jgi:voltage-gated potassium channel
MSSNILQGNIKMKKLKLRIYNLIREGDVNGLASNIFDGVIICLIILNVILVILDTFKLPGWFEGISYYIEFISIIVFTIEFILRVWVSDIARPEDNPIVARIKYLFTLMALIDLLAILPFYIPFVITVDLRVLRLLRTFRLMRLFKVNRYTSALKTIADVFKHKASQLITSLFIILILMIISSIIIYNVENPAQPEIFSNAFSGMWWAIVTLTTVGYGDIYPITIVGRIFSAVISILGIGLIAMPTGIISAGFIERTANKQKESSDSETNKKRYCPYCGKLID